jgi:arylsulfatase A
MNNRRWILGTVLGLFFIMLPASLNAEETQRPNFLVILCDDLGWGDLSCFGHPHVQTENLDRLADGGIRLTACYSAAPVCSPSRVGLLTGRNPNRAGIYDWIPAAPATGLAAPYSRHLVHLRRQEITLPKLLKQAGYLTAMAGKWHCNSMFNSPDQPQPSDAGFDHWLATQNNAGPSHKNPDNFVRNGQAIGPMQGYSCQLVADEAIQWLESNYRSSQSKPFFLYIPFHEPHEPIESPEYLVDQYRAVAATENEAQYFANVHNMDLAAGRLLQTLEQLNLSDNTFIFFSSDNGPETLERYPSASRSYGRPGPLRGMKLWTTEAGVRVPGIIRWPDQIAAGQISDTPISSLDLLPTFCSLAKVPPPAVELDGMDVLPILLGNEQPRDKPLFWFYYSALNEHRAALVDDKWKLLAKLNGGQLPKMANISRDNFELVRAAELTDFSLYNLSEDIGEMIDVASQYPEELRRLTQKMNDIYHDLVQQMHVWPNR